MKIQHATALALLIMTVGCESQANQEYRAERFTRRNPPTLTTTASSVQTAAAQSSPPGWLLIVPPEEPRPLGASREMTESPLSQWLVKGTYPTQSACDAVLHPKPTPMPAASTGKVVTAPVGPTQVIGPFSVYWPSRHSLSSTQCIASDDVRLAGTDAARRP